MSLFDEFEIAAKEAALDLDLNLEKIQFDRDETPKIGLDYTARLYENNRGFDFYLKTRPQDEEALEYRITASLAIDFSEGATPYYFRENINYLIGHPKFLSRWISWAIFNYRIKYEKVNLQSLFSGLDLRVYGFPGYCSPAEEEAEVLFNGMMATQTEKALVYKFRHITKESYLCRDISYAVYVRPRNGHSFWVIFPNNCGLDSGGGHSAYRHFETLIELLKSKLEVEVKRYDIEYHELENFLLKSSIDFFSCPFENVIEPFHRFFATSNTLISQEQVQKLLERLEKKEYPQALRDLRALVQQSQEKVANLKNLDYSTIRKPNIHKLASFLVQKKQLDGNLLPWFDAFTSIANQAAHRDFPTSNDMRNSRHRILLTFYLGMQLIMELDAIVRHKIPFTNFPSFSIENES